MIDLGSKPIDYSSKPSAPEAATERSYPSLSITTDKDIPLPAGEFEATVKLRLKGHEWSTEGGKKRCTYRFDVLGIEPGEETETDSEETDDGEAPDAAMSIMQSMQKARNSKIEADDGE